jgi:1,4-dihydroxy-2-naphthoyl-CoA hydrolase
MPVELGRTLDGTLGVEWIEAGEETARARIPVADKLKQPMGLVHGGVFAALAESLASAATYMAVREDGMVAVGMSNHTTFMRPITDGTIHGEARRRHRGRSTWLWDVEITDDDGRVCALSRVTMAVRPARRS